MPFWERNFESHVFVDWHLTLWPSKLNSNFKQSSSYIDLRLGKFLSSDEKITQIHVIHNNIQIYSKLIKSNHLIGKQRFCKSQMHNGFLFVWEKTLSNIPLHQDNDYCKLNAASATIVNGYVIYTAN